MTISLTSPKPQYAPLDKIQVNADPGSQFSVLDGDGVCYHQGETDGNGSASFLIGGALGSHTIICPASTELTTASFKVDAKTTIQDSKNVFAPLLRDLYLTMVNSCGGDGSQLIMVEGKLYRYFIRWLRDHTHTMKGMKYFDRKLKTGLELYADTQRKDGMIYDRIAQTESDAQNWRDYTFSFGDFVRKVYSNADQTGTPYTLQRIPVENDVEFLFLECLYYVWQATGDTEWMKQYLDNAIAAVRYSTSDPYRWSKKFSLLKRGYTIDTWDFMHDDDVKLTLGDNVCDLEKTTFGVMFGDNTGMAAGCHYLAEMLRAVGRDSEAPEFDQLADQLFAALDEVAWNGEFYTHHVTEDPSFKRDVGNTDESAQVTLSNAYSINRKIGTDKSQKIIQSYQKIRQGMPENSPGEFYNCYPPFENGFNHQDSLWQYMNGGVSSIVAGELARGAFCFGEETYGADILRRIKELADRHDGHLHVCFHGNPETTPPERTFTQIDLSGVANVSPSWREKSGWGDPGNDLSRLPRGEQSFCGVPFAIADEGVAISSTRSDYSTEVTIPVNDAHASLYFLHTKNGGNLAAELTVSYEDGSHQTIYLEEGKQLSNWFMPEVREMRTACHAPKLPKGWPAYQLAWRGGNDTFDNVGVFLWGWDNPCPEKIIASISLKAFEGTGSYFLLGLTGSDHGVWFPQSDLSFGIPDGWGAAAVVYALVEGLAGVVDTGLAFSEVEVTPRWDFADESKADVVVKYEASGGYVAYHWENSAAPNLLLSSCADKTKVRIPLTSKKELTATVNGKAVPTTTETVGGTVYLVIELTGRSVFDIKLG